MRSAAEHVVHVGYHKTASTWLQVCVFPRLGGIRYTDPLLRPFVTALSTAPDDGFGTDGVRELRRQIAPFADQRLLISHEGISGSLWDGYGDGPRNAERLHSVLPDAEILIVVRRQDEMLRSIHAQYVNEGGTRSLADFVAGEKIEGSRFSLRHLEYDRLVGRYVELFGSERIWVMPYEYLRARRADFLGDLCEAVGASLASGVSNDWPNRSLSRSALLLLRTWNRLFRESRFNQHPLVRSLPGGRRMRNLLQGHLDSLLRAIARNKLAGREEALLARAAAGFAESNRRLQRFCRQPLVEWGYPLHESVVSPGKP